MDEDIETGQDDEETDQASDAAWAFDKPVQANPDEHDIGDRAQRAVVRGCSRSDDQVHGCSVALISV
jgi:hypothetical protein